MQGVKEYRDITLCKREVFDMEKLFQSFIAELQQKNHLKILLPAHPLAVRFCIEEGCWSLTLSRENIIWQSVAKLESIMNLEIKLNSQLLQQVLLGKVRLSNIVKSGELIYKGSYRHFLLLESLLWLGCTREMDKCG